MGPQRYYPATQSLWGPSQDATRVSHQDRQQQGSRGRGPWRGSELLCQGRHGPLSDVLPPDRRVLAADPLPAAVNLVLRVAQPAEAEPAQVRDARRGGRWPAPTQYAAAFLRRAGRDVRTLGVCRWRSP